ncbi:MAG TPA: AI-2E family transporter [Pseudonocardia sp.]|nr:AI-2E family transporter [Pseudonocardia sp.]
MSAQVAGGPVGRGGDAPEGRGLGVLPRGLVVLLGAAAVVIVAAGLRSIAWFIGPAFLALIIVIAVAPVQRRLRQWGWPAWLTTLVLVLAVYGVILALGLTVLISLARLATEVPKYAPDSAELVAGVNAQLARFGVGAEQLQQVASSLDLSKVGGVVQSLLASVAGLASNVVFILVLLLFLSVEARGAGDRVAMIGADRPAVAKALTDFAGGTRQYLIVSTVFGLIVAVLDGIALAIIGIPIPVTWALLAFITNYIPNIGFVLGVIPPALLGLLIGGPQMMIVVIVVYSVLNFVIQSLIQPRFVGDAVNLSVTVTFLALAFWAWLIGPLGAILAIPLTLFARAILVDIDPRAGWADAFLRSSAPGPDATAGAGTGGAGTGGGTGGDAAGKSEPAARRSRWRRERHREQAATP